MASVFDHLHLKRNTAGSSNELSFDVLEAASSAYGKKSASSSRLSIKPRQDRGSYHGVTGASTFSGQAEVERRKKQRRRQTRRIKVVTATVVLGVAFVFLFSVYQHYLEVQDYSTRFDALVGRFGEEDAFLAELDSAMQTSADDSQLRQDLARQIPSIREDIEHIASNASNARPLAISEEDEIALGQIMEAADSRIAMLDAAQESFALLDQRSQRASDLTGIWNGIASEWQEAQQAATLANEALTQGDTQKARDATQQAREGFEKSLLDLKMQASQEPEVDVSAQQEYLTVKISSLEAGVETADALIEGDREKAREKNDEYNELDSKAAMLALALPPTLDTAVETAYAPSLAEAKQSYDEARNRAINADSLIREYLSRR